jgi:presenilin-like A22 family membrane protease
MDLTPLLATAGWTSFSGIFSTVFPLVVLIAVLAWYAMASKKHP